MRLRADPPQLICDKATRDAAGLDHWVDGTLGIARFDGRTIAVAPNGRQLATHDLTGLDTDSGGFIDGLTSSRTAIQGLDPMVDHASGGPLLRDPETGTLVLVYHGEHFHHGDPTNFWSFLGLAVSADDGTTFHDLGPVITVPTPPDPPVEYLAEIGGGGFVLRDGFMQIYFTDRGNATIRTKLATARCPVDDVFAAASRREAPRFAKYHAGSWGEPGLGGAATDLLADTCPRVQWADVATLSGTGDVLLVFSTTVRIGDRRWGWSHMASVSHDGLVFESAVPLYDRPDPAELIYVSIDADGEQPRCIDGSHFDLYRIRSTTPYRWDSACLERVTVHIDLDPR